MNIIKAMRVPFLSASILAYIYGSLVLKYEIKWGIFFLGLVAVVGLHLGANLINDYFDSLSGVDWEDRQDYVFFGGSKCIQNGVFSERFYLIASICCFIISMLSAIILITILHSKLLCFLLVISFLLAIMYTASPLALSYHRMGEAVIFLMFGPLLVMGAAYLQSGIFWDWDLILASLPFGFLTTMILISNEVPDYVDDVKFGKYNWVSIIGPERAYILYAVFLILGFATIFLLYIKSILSFWSLFSFISLIFGYRAVCLLKYNYIKKSVLVKASVYTISLHTFVGSLLIVSLIK